MVLREEGEGEGVRRGRRETEDVGGVGVDRSGGRHVGDGDDGVAGTSGGHAEGDGLAGRLPRGNHADADDGHGVVGDVHDLQVLDDGAVIRPGGGGAVIDAVAGAVEAEIDAVGIDFGAGARRGPEEGVRVGGGEVADVVVFAFAVFDAEVGGERRKRVGLRGADVTALALIEEQHGGEDGVLHVRIDAGGFPLGHAHDTVVVVEEPAVLALQRGGGLAGEIDAAVELRDGARVVGGAGRVGGILPDVHLVPGLEVRNVFAEILLELVEPFPLVGGVVGVKAGDGVFLAVEDHGDAVDGGDHGVAGGGGLRVAERNRLVVAGEIEEDEAVAVGGAALFEGGGERGGGANLVLGEAEDHVFVEDVELAVGAVADLAAVERFGHEQEVPLERARAVDEVLPELVGEALRVVAAEAVDAVVVGEDAVGVADARMVHAVVAGFLEPVFGIGGHVFPEQLGGGHHVVIIVHVLFAVDAAGFLGQRVIGGDAVVVADHGGVVAVEQLGDVIPLAEIEAFRRGGDVVVGHAVVIAGGVALDIFAFGLVRIPAQAERRRRDAIVGGNVAPAELDVVEFAERGVAEAVGGIGEAFAENGVPAGVVHDAIEHDVDGFEILGAAAIALGLVAQADVVREGGDGAGFGLGGARLVVDGEIILGGVGAAGIVAIAAGVGVAAIVLEVGVDGLEPEAIHAEAVEIVQAELVEGPGAGGEFFGERLEGAGAGVFR